MTDLQGQDVKKDLEPNAVDGALSITRTLVGIVPLVGSPLTELVTAIFGSPVSKRRDDWLIYVVEGLEETKARLKDFAPENLKDNEQFISATLQATQIAIRNHQREKLEALRNAVLNTAIGINIDETVQLMFIEAIDTLTPLHLRVLKYFDDPKAYFENNNVPVPTGYQMGSRSQILELALPEIKGNQQLSKIVVNELAARGLLSDGSMALTTVVSQDGLFNSLSSDMGKAFLQYINDPNKTSK